ncbi:copper chaperone PCu(A)C [Rhodobacteraceae bacterium RKSG542]|uniref:copper chaperone PCu(A)C n=1 Tax=Pseudovibrio flavus TaxID=2529854 RepID=UPI0012BC2631|nr:copper chaperone PCu(A)C [Pseudovibrio flavus]MTI18736.1 copper chaperone PCu(A)C [Pseudovibrio flavus]
MAKLARLALMLTLSLAPLSANAEMVSVGDLELSKIWTRATPLNAKAGGAYVTITNKGETADTLVGAASDIAKKTEIHEMAVKDGVMLMRKLEGGLVIEPGQSVELKPGSFHVMFMGLKAPIKKGEMVEVTLQFENAGDVPVKMPAAKIGAKTPAHAKH